MVNVTGSNAIGGINQTGDNLFGDQKFFYEWIEFTNNPGNLTQAGFNTTNGTIPATTPIYAAGGTDNLNALATDASANTIGNSNSGNPEQFGIRVSTTLTVTTAGTYEFDVRSDDGMILYVNGIQVINDDSIHAPRNRLGTISLGAGNHDIVILYFENTGQNVLEASIRSVGVGDYPTKILLQNANVRANANNDTIDGAGGNDTILGGAGTDSLSGGSGNDSIDGGIGNDTILGGAGNDTILGGDGNDNIDGGTENDSILGGLGNDSILGGAGLDTISGGDGNDTIDGGADNDSILGGAGLDSLFGGSGNDTIDGGADNDSIDGGIGNDSLLGGTGNDTILGGDGNDTIDGGADNDSILGGAGLDSLFGGTGDDTLDGGADNDSLNGGIGNDSLIGGDGNDTLDGGDGNDAFNAGAGNDLIFGGAGNDSNAVGDLGNDTYFGGAGNDTLSGDAGDDSIFGGDDDDVLEGHDGADFVSGDAGNDYITGFDILGITTVGPAGNLNPPVGSDDNANDTLLGGTGNDTIFGGGGDDSIEGGADNDIIFGGTGNDTITGDAGIDTIFGGDGNDTIDGGADNDSIEGGAGNDSILGGTGDDTITGGTGLDTILGGDGNDTIDAGADNDTVDGGLGDDIIRASTGADQIAGGTGTDTYTVPTTSTLGVATETITVTVDQNGNGTVLKTVNGTTDTIGSVENFIADEAAAENDRLIFTSIVTDEGTITGLSGSTGTFTPATGSVIAFGGAGQPTFTDVLALNRTGDFTTTGGSLTGTVGAISFTDFETVNFSVVCFASGVMIETPEGCKPVQTLCAGDMVKTLDSGDQEIRWIGSRKITASALAENPRLNPIRIARGALGVNIPSRDLIVSRQHRILIRSAIAVRMFDTSEVLVAAKDLLSIDGVEEFTPSDGVIYFHILLDGHELVWADGALAETLLTGAEAMKTMSLAARREILTIFPHIETTTRNLSRLCPKSELVRKMIDRHIKNVKVLVDNKNY